VQAVTRVVWRSISKTSKSEMNCQKKTIQKQYMGEYFDSADSDRTCHFKPPTNWLLGVRQTTIGLNYLFT
jgi:hypothetical protein